MEFEKKLYVKWDFGMGENIDKMRSRGLVFRKRYALNNAGKPVEHKG